MRAFIVLVVVGLGLTACPRIAVNFSTDPSILRGAWTGTIRQTCPINLSNLAWSLDGTRLATIVTSPSGTISGNTLTLWDASSGVPQRTIAFSNDFGRFVFGWKPDGSSLMVASQSSGGFRIESFDASSGASISVRDLPLSAWASSFVLSRDLRKLAAVIVAPTAASGTQPQLSPPPPKLELVVWNLQTGLEERHVSLGTDAYVWDMAFNPDGSSIVVALYMTVRLFGPDLTPRDLSLPSGRTAYNLGWNADGSQLSATSLAGIRTWRVSDGNVLRDLNLGQTGVYLPTFSPDARQLALSRDTRQLEVWNLETASKSLTVSIEAVSNIAFNPDGARLAVGQYERCNVLILETSRGTTAGIITFASVDADRSISLNLTASFVDERGYAITGTATIENEPVYTVQGIGWVGSNEYLVPSVAPTPRGAALTLRDPNGATPWGMLSFNWSGNTPTSRYNAWWLKPDGKQYTVQVNRSQP